MKRSEYVTISSFEEETGILKEGEGKHQAMAGGSDLLGIHKDRILKTHPEAVVNLKQIPEFNTLEKTDDWLSIEARCKLNRIARDQTVKDLYPTPAETTYSVTSLPIRFIGTVGGSVRQDVRCWHCKYPDTMGGALDYKRKGGRTCCVINGENRHHSVFGEVTCHGSPCAGSCPAGTDVPAYMARLRNGDWDGATRIIAEYSPMPMTASRICPHPCRDDCNQRTYGDSANIHGVERSLGDYTLEHADIYYVAPEYGIGKTVSIVGAGSDGLSAAYYLRRSDHQVMVYDHMEKVGGAFQYSIPHYRLPKHIVDVYMRALKHMGVKSRFGARVGKDIALEEIGKNFRRMYVGTGAWEQPILGLEGENLTQLGPDSLVEVNTYLEKAIGSQVLVCGGENAAMGAALTAAKLGAKHAKLIYPKQGHEIPATPRGAARVKEEGAEIYRGQGLGKVVTDRDKKVTGLAAKKCLPVFNGKHRFAPVYEETGQTFTEADTIVLATGQRVGLDLLGEWLREQLKSARGLIEAGLELFRAEEERTYAGGDAVTGLDIVIHTILTECVAVTGMDRELGEEGRMMPGGDLVLDIGLPQADPWLHFDPRVAEEEAAHKLAEVSPEERTLTGEDTTSFDWETAQIEAGRCMNCGRYAMSPSGMSPVLVMVGAEIIITECILTAQELLTREPAVQDTLEPGELVEEIQASKLKGEIHCDKKRVRNAIDFAIISLVSCLEIGDHVVRDARIVFGGIAPISYHMSEMGEFLRGKGMTEEVAEEAAALTVRDAVPVGKNEYKLFMIKEPLINAILKADNKQ